MLSFTQYTQSVSPVKCSTIVSNRFTILSFNTVRFSNTRIPSSLRPEDVYYYIVCLAYVIRPLSLIKSVFPKVVNSCIPTIPSRRFLFAFAGASELIPFGANSDLCWNCPAGTS